MLRKDPSAEMVDGHVIGTKGIIFTTTTATCSLFKTKGKRGSRYIRTEVATKLRAAMTRAPVVVPEAMLANEAPEGTNWETLHCMPTERREPTAPYWWWYKGEFYKTSEVLRPDDVKALIEANEAKRNRKLAHAHAVAATSKSGAAATRPGIYNDRYITPEVKQSVWQRDGGHCSRCGSNENLEFDHIIPVSMGGSSTARNIQLLCEACNRSKGGSIV